MISVNNEKTITVQPIENEGLDPGSVLIGWTAFGRYGPCEIRELKLTPGQLPDTTIITAPHINPGIGKHFSIIMSNSDLEQFAAACIGAANGEYDADDIEPPLAAEERPAALTPETS